MAIPYDNGLSIFKREYPARNLPANYLPGEFSSYSPSMLPQYLTGAYSVNVPGLGHVKYFKIGDLSVEELNNAIAADLITYTDPVTGQISKISHYNLFNQFENNAAAPWSPANGARDGIDLYEVQYFIRNPQSLDSVTGLLAVPTSAYGESRPVLSWQHGTIFFREDAPSRVMRNDQLQKSPEGSNLVGLNRSAETLFNLVRFAGNGFVLAAADYNGNGGSMSSQYYAVKEPTNKATAGMIKASMGVLARLGVRTENLFLNGWSQGALNTLWLGQNLQSAGIPVAKQAGSSSFSDLNKSLDYWFNSSGGTPYWLTSCLPLVLGAYESYYGLKGLMAEAVKPQYLDTARRIYEGKIDWDRIPPVEPGKGLLGLPLTGREFLNENFIQDFNNKQGAFYAKTQENQVLETKLSHPSRFYGGGQDTVLPPGVSVELPTEFMAPLATGINVGENATHRSTFLGSLFGSAQSPDNDILTWFESPL